MTESSASEPRVTWDAMQRPWPPGGVIGVLPLSDPSPSLLPDRQAADVLMKRLPEARALVDLAGATDGAACPVFEVGPLANHLVGITAAERPDYHPCPTSSGLPNRPEALVRAACDLGPDDPITPRYPDLQPPSPLLHVTPISDGALSRPPSNAAHGQAAVEHAIKAIVKDGDVDAALPDLDGRLAALLSLADRAKAAGGGVLADRTADAVKLLARSLAGPTRWAVVQGWERNYDWPINWRHGAAGVMAHSFLCSDQAAAVVVSRLLRGPAIDDLTDAPNEPTERKPHR